MDPSRQLKTQQQKRFHGRMDPLRWNPSPPVPAPTPTDKSDAISTNLEKELTCSICTSIFHHPVTLLDCLHSYCGSCAKEWFTSAPSNQQGGSYPVSKGCPTCRQSVRAIKPSPHLASITEMFIKHNPQHARDPEEITKLAKVYTPGDRIITDRSPGDSRNRSLSSLSNRRAGEGWWDAWVDDNNEGDEEQFYAAISASLRDLIPRATTGFATPSSSISGHAGTSSGSGSHLTGISAIRRPTFLTTALPPAHAVVVDTPQVNCDHCGNSHIGSHVHYHCNICREDDFDMCHGCFSRGERCPGRHEMISRKFNTDNGVMEKGIFCDTQTCRKMCNEIFWSCSTCTTSTGTYKYCPECVNSAASCNHDLVAFSASAQTLRRFGLGSFPHRQGFHTTHELVQPAPVSVTTRCDLCSEQIAPSTTYFHCRSCHDADWDCHTSCLSHYLPRNSDGIAKCLAHHPLQALIQVQMPDARNPTHFVRRALPTNTAFNGSINETRSI
ncbi:hypothetical protein TWF970_005177 [Orbilia oligospora]|uniref:Uncharacterized protein n=1 Tax=Orbilia oligospora TaxID=2813651 RepID=A0A7C8V5E4_ORBOL|nr:hypothetical protein TWF970_005177 [Orbilia oligospora]